MGKDISPTENEGDYVIINAPLPAGNNIIGSVISEVTIGSVSITVGSLTVIKDNATGSLATVRDLPSNDALNVALVDATGSQITSFGGGTQYTEGDVDTTITGTALLGEAPGDILKAIKTRSSGELIVDSIGLGSYSFKAIDLTAGGDTTIVSPKTGSALRLKWIYASNFEAFLTPIVAFKFGTGSYFFKTLLFQGESRLFPLHGNNLQGSPTEALIGSLHTSFTFGVSVTAIYEDI